MKTWLFETCRR